MRQTAVVGVIICCTVALLACQRGSQSSRIASGEIVRLGTINEGVAGSSSARLNGVSEGETKIYKMTLVATLPGKYLIGLMAACKQLQRDSSLNCSGSGKSGIRGVKIIDLDDPAPGWFAVAFKASAAVDEFGRPLSLVYSVDERTGEVKLVPKI